MKIKSLFTRRALTLYGVTIFVVALSFVLYFSFFRHTKDTVRWEVGKRYLYEIDYTSKSYNHFLNPKGTAQTLSGDMDCIMKLVVTPVKELPSKDVLAELSFHSISQCSFFFNGEDIFADKKIRDTIFLDRRAAVVFSPDGAVKDLRFFKNEEAVFVSTMKLFISYFQMSLKKEGVEQKETDQHGESLVTFSKKGSGDLFTLKKSVKSYTSFLAFPSGINNMQQDGSGEFKYDIKEGVLHEITGSQTITLRENSKKVFDFKVKLSYELLSVNDESDTEVIRLSLSGMSSSKLGKVEMSEKIRKMMDEKQSRNMTRTEMLSFLQEYSDNDEIHNKQLFMWRFSLTTLHSKDRISLVVFYERVV